MKKKLVMLFGAIILAFVFLIGWITVINATKGEKYTKVVLDQQQYNNHTIPFKRGDIIDRNGTKLATSERVYNVIIDAEILTSKKKYMNPTLNALKKCFNLKKNTVRKQVKKNPNSRYLIVKTGVSYEDAQKFTKISEDTEKHPNVQGVWLEEDYERKYPYNTLASDVIGFTTNGNVGSNGIEASYNSSLNGTNGREYGYVDENSGFERTVKEPANGSTVVSTIDLQVQSIVEQHILAFNEEHKDEETEGEGSKSTGVIVMNPQNGEIYAMVNVPEYDLNDPFSLSAKKRKANSKKQQEYLNKKWRNSCLNDTYEPGSVFKIVTATAGLESSKVSVNDHFNCPGFRIVEDRKIRCHKVGGHGSETFKEGVMNSCNPVFMDVGARVGVDGMYQTFRQLGLFEKTGIDLPGEASSIMHQKKNVGAVELATMSFGQSIQITPLQLLRAVSAVINGGKLITPHFGRYVQKQDGTRSKVFSYPVKEGVIKKQTSETMKELLEAVVSDGSGRNCRMDGFSIGGKTATSEKLPRGNGKYISSFLGFAKADNPAIIGIVLIDEPHGTYYGGTIAAPVMRSVFQTALPYMGIYKEYTPDKKEP